ncbi:MAG TPA: hypothetical protein EYH41_03460 [Novosphingobium capsulatum]|jgi:hypothetical protein|nr:hypothetical protein [Novosphingobium aromaticivorans]HIQ17046.1 hypothetical protein [Novosphingobium capsulatum]
MTDAAPTPSDYPALTCQCGATTLTDRDAAPLCLGCPSCGTALRLRGPWPRPEPHNPGPRDRDDPASPVVCRVCGQPDPAVTAQAETPLAGDASAGGGA